MTVKYTQPCWVSNQECEAPAGRGSSFGVHVEDYRQGGGARFTCYACGLPVCGKCSKVAEWYGKKERICDYCREEHKRAPA